MDHSLMDATGHHLNVTQALCETLKSTGHRPRVLAHQTFSRTHSPEIDVAPVFMNHAYDGLNAALEVPTRFTALARKFSIELQYFLEEHGNAF